MALLLVLWGVGGWGRGREGGGGLNKLKLFIFLLFASRGDFKKQKVWPWTLSGWRGFIWAYTRGVFAVLCASPEGYGVLRHSALLHQ